MLFMSSIQRQFESFAAIESFPSAYICLWLIVMSFFHDLQMLKMCTTTKLHHKALQVTASHCSATQCSAAQCKLFLGFVYYSVLNYLVTGFFCFETTVQNKRPPRNIVGKKPITASSCDLMQHRVVKLIIAL